MTPEQASIEAAKVCQLAPVVPVIVVDDAATAGDLAQALVSGGLPALEVTLRTPAALDAIREMAKIEGGVQKKQAQRLAFPPAQQIVCWTRVKQTTCHCFPVPHLHPKRCVFWNVVTPSKNSSLLAPPVARLC